MRISTRGRYGLRAMIELARRYDAGPVSLGDVSRSQCISRKYLHSLLAGLKNAGLVRGVRGVEGGFVLARSPSDIRLDEILLNLEGPLSATECAADEHVCDMASNCAARRVWIELTAAIDGVLQRYTLADMLEKRLKTRGSAVGARKTKTSVAGKAKAGKS